ncbi:MAG: hypothetical protein IPJ00_11090 [Saprospirales bacterium]|nr:hypothetical protein [Saprospirales bacterium]
MKTYYELIRRIETTNPSRCSLLKAGRICRWAGPSPVLSAYDPGGNLGIGFQAWSSGVSRRGRYLTRRGQLVSYWYPVLSVYKE